MADPDENIVVTKSPEGKVLQSYGTLRLEPQVVFDKAKQLAKTGVWGRLFAVILEKKRPGDPVLCWLKCKQCSDLLSPSNISRAHDGHQKAYRAFKRQAVHFQGSASCNVSQRLSFGEASASGSGGETEPAPGSLQVSSKRVHFARPSLPSGCPCL